MKKYLFLFMIASTVLLSSCKKDDDNLTADNLAGTTWVSDDKESSVKFISKTQFEFNWTDYFNGGKYPQMEEGIYSVNTNKITFDFGDGDPMTGIIEDNSMTFVWLGDVIVVKKQ